MEPKIGLMLRLPQPLRDEMAQLAKEQSRSLNAQIVHMLSQAIRAEKQG